MQCQKDPSPRYYLLSGDCQIGYAFECEITDV